MRNSMKKKNMKKKDKKYSMLHIYNWCIIMMKKLPGKKKHSSKTHMRTFKKIFEISHEKHEF